MTNSHMGIKERNLFQRIPCVPINRGILIVGEFFNVVEAQLRIKKSVVRLRHPLRFTTPSFSFEVPRIQFTQLSNFYWGAVIKALKP